MGRVSKKCDWCGEAMYSVNQSNLSVKHSVIGWAAGMQDKYSFCSKRCQHEHAQSNSAESANDDFSLESSSNDGEGITFTGIAKFIKWSLILFGLGWLCVEMMK